MTMREFHTVLEPVAERWLDFFRRDGAAAVDNACAIACVKAFLYRLDMEADDDDGVEIPLFGEVSPEWFFAQLVEVVHQSDTMGGLLSGGGTAHEAFMEALGEIRLRKEAENAGAN